MKKGLLHFYGLNQRRRTIKFALTFSPLLLVEITFFGITGFAEPARGRRVSVKRKLRNRSRAALTDDVRSREILMKGVEHSDCYEGDTAFKAEAL